MLKTEKQGKYKRHVIIETEKGTPGIGYFHEWQVWLEEKSVVVISNEAFASRECPAQCSQTGHKGTTARRANRLRSLIFVHFETRGLANSKDV